jgi:hypothetical protein
MDTTDDSGKVARPERATAAQADGATAASHPVGEHPFGPDAVAIVATEHWSLIGSRSLLWNEAMSRTAIFLSVLSAAIVALALLANATGLGRTPPPWRWCCCRSCSSSASPSTSAWWRSTEPRLSSCWP